MKRFIALALLAFSLTTTAQAGFMPGIIHDRAPRPERGWTQGVPERSAGKTCRLEDAACTLHWSGQEERADGETSPFIWWGEALPRLFTWGR